MKHAEFIEWMEEHEACASGRALVAVNAWDSQQTWDSFTRADWLMWYATRQIGDPGWPTREQVVKTVCLCTARALKYTPVEKTSASNAVQVTTDWADGKASFSDVQIAVRTARNEPASISLASVALLHESADPAKAHVAIRRAVNDAAQTAADYQSEHLAMCAIIRAALTCPLPAEVGVIK